MQLPLCVGVGGKQKTTKQRTHARTHREALAVGRVDDEDEGVVVLVVVPPQLPQPVLSAHCMHTCVIWEEALGLAGSVRPWILRKREREGGRGEWTQARWGRRKQESTDRPRHAPSQMVKEMFLYSTVSTLNLYAKRWW